MNPQQMNGSSQHPSPIHKSGLPPSAVESRDVLRYGNVLVSIELLGPKEAESYLANAARNRIASAPRVRAIAEDMLKNRWMFTASGIVFNEEGQLIDGEHRLRAVVESGATVPILVMRNASAAVRKVIDTNRPRSIPDILRITGAFEDANRLTATVRIFEWLITGSIGKAPTLTATRVERLVEAYEGPILWALNGVGDQRRIDTAPVLAALAFAYPTDPDRIEEFAIKLRTGARLAENEPALLLRNMLTNASTHLAVASERYDMALRVLRAAQAHLRGQTLETLRATDGARLFFAQHFGPSI
jgi:hypothetical protein